MLPSATDKRMRISMKSGNLDNSVKQTCCFVRMRTRLASKGHIALASIEVGVYK